SPRRQGRDQHSQTTKNAQRKHANKHPFHGKRKANKPYTEKSVRSPQFRGEQAKPYTKTNHATALRSVNVRLTRSRDRLEV
ncbi:transcriptional regulator, partial [Lacticaseibacillus rhamnosus MTCC 5462]